MTTIARSCRRRQPFAAAAVVVAALLLALSARGTASAPAATDNDDGVAVNAFGQPTYGVDTSFPIHSLAVEPPETNPLGDRQSAYETYISGCRAHYGTTKGQACDYTEKERVAMALRQPRAMQNYTKLGFKKTRAPEIMFELIRGFWEKNKEKTKSEQWYTGNTYVNHWDNQIDFVSVEDGTLRGGGALLKARIWEAAKDTLEEWTGEELSPCSLYGIRIYHEGAVLATHVDRMPLVSSAIINVAQDLDEPWPLEVYAHDGRAYNVSMQPGDMILYESHSVLHGRPFPLKGRFYANIFIHFEPVGHSLRHGVEAPADGGGGDVAEQYRRAAELGHGGHENAGHGGGEGGGAHDGGLPPYLLAGTEEAERFRHGNPKGWKKTDATGFDTGSSIAHKAAIAGDVDTLKEIAEANKKALHKKDQNGWQPMHEAARAGHKDVIALLVAHGGNINERTNHGRGATPLRLATQAHGVESPLVAFMKEMGALELGPDL